MKIICISDTHTLHKKVNVPEGDVLIHAGDSCARGHITEFERFIDWLALLPHKTKILVAGNHDWCWYKYPQLCKDVIAPHNIIYLEDSGCEVDGLKIYGSPWQPEFCDWAFNLPRGRDELQHRWSNIPDDTDVLITHGPPYGFLDQVNKEPHLGCELLAQRVREVGPKLHIFGHIHDGYGIKHGTQKDFVTNNTLFVNASICTEQYRPENKPITVTIA